MDNNLKKALIAIAALLVLLLAFSIVGAVVHVIATVVVWAMWLVVGAAAVAGAYFLLRKVLA